jgi:hypothetical protein
MGVPFFSEISVKDFEKLVGVCDADDYSGRELLNFCSK